METMRIDINDKIHLYKGVATKSEFKYEKQKLQQVGSGNFDQIEIRNGNHSAKEQLFFDKMVKKLQQNIMEDTKEEKINKLKEEIQNNTYTFDVTEIVSKILIEKGE